MLRWSPAGLRSAVSAHVGALAIGIGSAIGLSTVALSASALYDFAPERASGFFGAVSPAWYVGAALLVCCAVWAIRMRTIPGVPVTAVALVIPLSTALAYSEPHTSWAVKHVGVTLYVMRHGSVDRHIDLYQAWPGLFAGVGWACHAIGVSNIMGVARWWPPVADVGTLFVLYELARRVLGNRQRAWAAALLFVVGNTIGQDYFSPQSAGYILALGIFALSYGDLEDQPRPGDWVLILGLSLGVAVTHPLSPYLITAALVALAVFGLIRSRLIPLATFAPAAAWAAVNWNDIRPYLNVAQLGRIFSNVLPQGYASPGFHKDELIRVNSAAMGGDALLLGLLALVSLIQNRDRKTLAIAVCAASGVGLLFANGYGNEGIFRVVLFALPWLCILAAGATLRRRWFRGAPAAALAAALFAPYAFAELGLDYMRTVRPGDVQAVRAFDATATSGSTLYVIGYSFAPLMAGANYSEFTYKYYASVADGSRPNQFNAAASYRRFWPHSMSHQATSKGDAGVYVLVATEPAIAMDQVGLATLAEYWRFAGQIGASGQWRLVSKTNSAELFRLCGGASCGASTPHD